MGDDSKPSTAWHTEFQDVNNDGLVDLFVAKGNVWEMPDFAAKDPNNLLLQQADGKFVEVGDKAGVASVAQGRGGALVDLNLDGLVDLLVVNRNEPSELWRNTTAGAGRWLLMRLVQPGPNRDAIGASVEVRCGEHVMRRELTVGGGHAGGELGWRHFGVADLDKTEVRVIWPDGTEEPWQTVASDAFYILERGKPAQVWTPAR
jgi:hypothetical protein